MGRRKNKNINVETSGNLPHQVKIRKREIVKKQEELGRYINKSH